MKEKLIFICIFLFVYTLHHTPYTLFANAADQTEGNIEEELKAIKSEVQELRKEVEILKTRGAARQPAPPQEIPEATVSIDDDPVKGTIDAPVTIIEFSDYQCPFCGRFFANTFPEINKKYIESGKVKYVFRDFPLEFHKQAPKASEAAECPGEKGKYWEMHDKLFENQNALTVDKLKQYAAEIGLGTDSFNACIDGGKYADEIKNDTDDGKKAAVSGTPTFFIGKTQGSKKEIVGKRLVGARPFSSFAEVIEQLLAEPGK